MNQIISEIELETKKINVSKLIFDLSILAPRSLIFIFLASILPSTVLGLPLNQEDVMKNTTPYKQNQSYPFTTQELWKRLKDVFQTPAKDLSKERVEEILNIKFHARDSINNPALPHYLEAVFRTEENLILRFSLNANKTNTHFAFNIDKDQGLTWLQPLPDGFCIERQMAAKDILSLGWLDSLEWRRTLPEQTSDKSYLPHAPPQPLENEKNFFRKGKVGTDSLGFTFLPYPGLSHEADELPSCISAISLFVYQ